VPPSFAPGLSLSKSRIKTPSPGSLPGLRQLADRRYRYHRALRKKGKKRKTGGTMRRKSAASLFGVAIPLLLAAVTGRTATAIPNCPFTISSAGSYVLVGNLASAGSCIAIAVAGPVTIDLHGYTISGNGTGSGISDGLGASTKQGVVIANGTITNFDTGIVVNLSHPVTIERMNVSNNRGQGIALFGAFTVINTIVDGNGSDGIHINGNLAGMILSSETNNDGGNGIVSLGGPTVVGDTIADANGQAGIALSVSGGIPTSGDQVIRSVAIGNGGNGIDLSAETQNAVVESVALQNGGAGIVLLCPADAVYDTARSNGAENLVEQVIPSSIPCANFNNVAP
jgi:hypothetical protein